MGTPTSAHADRLVDAIADYQQAGDVLDALEECLLDGLGVAAADGHVPASQRFELPAAMTRCPQ